MIARRIALLVLLCCLVPSIVHAACTISEIPTRAAGNVRPRYFICATEAERDALTGLNEGDLAYSKDTNSLAKATGASTWVAVVSSAATPGGSVGQLQYNNSGALGGVTLSGDCTVNTGTGAITCTKTGGSSFAPSATTDTTNASNISSGTLPNARLVAIPNASLANASVAVAGQTCTLGSTCSIAAVNLSNGVTGAGAVVLANTPTLITPILGVATVTSLNGLTITASTGTLAIPNGTTLNTGPGGTLGTAAFTAASAYEVPLTFSTGLTRSVNTITLNQAVVPMWSGQHTFQVNPIITNTAPGIILTDTTASAKGLTVIIDSNTVDFRESSAAVGSGLLFDLANNRMALGRGVGGLSGLGWGFLVNGAEIVATGGYKDVFGWLGGQQQPTQRAYGQQSGYGTSANPGNSNFTDTARWKTFDLTTVVSGLIGYVGGGFDGRYIYFAPNYNGSDSDFYVRYDTTGDFSDVASYDRVHANTLSGITKAQVRNGTVFDGTYLYFLPGDGGCGSVIRFNTQRKGNTAAGVTAFGDANNWQQKRVDALSTAAYCFAGGVFDGRYVYMAPSTKDDGTNTAWKIALRYDTEADFTANGSWQEFDTTGVDATALGFEGAVFDSRYVYFVPLASNRSIPTYSGMVIRYDTTTNAFTSAGSWAKFDATAVHTNAKGFRQAIFDGRYIYFVPNLGGTSGRWLRYDTAASFTAASSWITFDIAGIDANALGFLGAHFDGRYVYLTTNATTNARAVRYDTTMAFADTAAYTILTTSTISSTFKGNAGMVSDNRYLYFVPNYNGVSNDGHVQRYDMGAPDRQQGPGHVLRSAEAFLDAQGVLSLSSLTTTGSAGSKKVVCVDTTTGKLYASSTGVDCSN